MTRIRIQIAVFAIIAIAIALNIGAFSSEPHSIEAQEITAKPALLQIIRWEQGLKANDIEVASSFFAEDWIIHDPHLGNLSGIDGYTTWVEWYRGLMPDDFRYYVDDRSAMDNLTAVVWTITGTHSGSVEDVVPTDNYVSLSGVLFHRFEDGVLTESWVHYDHERLEFQIGLHEIDHPECEVMPRGAGCV